METTQQSASPNNRILLVDDDHSLREVISILLNDEGYEVLQADNGKKALEVLQSLKSHELPSCMILDLMMPVMSGDQLLEALETRYADDFGDIPVIVCSAEGKYRSYSKVVAKLEKPINMETLCAAIKGCSELQ